MPAEFIEPAIVPDIVVTRIAFSQEIAPDVRRFTFYNRQICPMNGELENVIVQKAVISRSDGISCARFMLRSFGVQSFCWIG